ncbi:MAG: endolytic transglycosylase MltG [Candidatus Shapirobacteria bacterium]|jgi:UPF0755 protein
MKKVVLVVLFLALMFAGITSFIVISSRPVSTSSKKQAFIVNQGESLLSVATRLHSISLIRNEFVFIVNSYLLGLNKKIQSGTFYLSPSLSSQQIAARLSQGGSHDYWLKIVDGYRTEEIALHLPAQAPYSVSEFISAAAGYQGYLFPDSYLIPDSYQVNQVIDLIKSNFNKKIESQASSVSSPAALHRQVIIASLIEREGRTLESKKMISGIIANRLQLGMPLQIDATVQYARDSKNRTKDYWRPLASADLSIQSPFNTYLTKDLPPSPICNPGLDSLMAAISPTASDYLYYITGTDGQMHYAKTLDDHNLNIAKYLK